MKINLYFFLYLREVLVLFDDTCHIAIHCQNINLILLKQRMLSYVLINVLCSNTNNPIMIVHDSNTDLILILTQKYIMLDYSELFSVTIMAINV